MDMTDVDTALTELSIAEIELAIDWPPVTAVRPVFTIEFCAKASGTSRRIAAIVFMLAL